MQIDKANIRVKFVRESNGEKIFSVILPHSDSEVVVGVSEWNEVSGVAVLKKIYNSKLAALEERDDEKAALAKVKAEIDVAAEPKPVEL